MCKVACRPLHSRLHVDPYVQGFHIGRLKFEVYFELIYACATEKDMAEDDIYKPSGYEPACVILTLFNFVKKGYVCYFSNK